MQKVLIFITFILSVQLSHGQYEYFNNLYQGDGFNGIYSGVITLDSTYVIAGINGNNGLANWHLSELNYVGEITEYDEYYSSNYLRGSWNYGFELNHQKDGFYYVSEGLNQNDSMASMLVSLNLDNSVNWINEFLISNPDSFETHLTSVEAQPDGLIVGALRSYPYLSEWDSIVDIVLMKLDLNGNLIWSNEINHSLFGLGDQLQFLEVARIHTLENDDLLLCVRNTVDFARRPALIKTDSEGNVLDWHVWGSEYLDWHPSVVLNTDETAMVAYVEGIDFALEDPLPMDPPIRRFHLMKFDIETMTPIWDSSYTPLLDIAIISDLLPALDGGFYLCGTASPTMYGEEIESLGIPEYVNQTGIVLKTSATGEFEWLIHYYHANEFPSILGELNYLYSFDIGIDGGIIAVGEQLSYDNGQHPWALKIDACGDVEDLGCPSVVAVDYQDLVRTDISVYPNPAIEQLTVSLPQNLHEDIILNIYNILGALVYSSQVSSRVGQEEIDVSHFNEGIYILQIVNEDGVLMNKSVFEKM